MLILAEVSSYTFLTSVTAVRQEAHLGHMERMDRESCLAIRWGRTENPFQHLCLRPQPYVSSQVIRDRGKCSLLLLLIRFNHVQLCVVA